MRVDGRWHTFDDDRIRPVIDAYVLTAAGEWVKVMFLLDAGADRTVFDASYLSVLAPLAIPAEEAPPLGGVGGRTDSVFVQTRLELTRDDGKPVRINGPFGVFTKMADSDVSVLGRDVTNNFDVIYSFPKQQVTLLAPPHTFVVQLPF